MSKALPWLLIAGALFRGAVALAEDGQYRLFVDGLACPFCAYGIEKQLGALDGVENVEMHIKDGAVVVVMAEGRALSEAAANRAVREAGFTLKRFEKVEP